jgi:hypothetical protein
MVYEIQRDGKYLRVRAYKEYRENYRKTTHSFLLSKISSKSIFDKGLSLPNIGWFISLYIFMSIFDDLDSEERQWLGLDSPERPHQVCEVEEPVSGPRIPSDPLDDL